MVCIKHKFIFFNIYKLYNNKYATHCKKRLNFLNLGKQWIKIYNNLFRITSDSEKRLLSLEASETNVFLELKNL